MSISNITYIINIILYISKTKSLFNIQINNFVYINTEISNKGNYIKNL